VWSGVSPPGDIVPGTHQYGSIMFAGGRDTVINSISGVIGHLAANLSDLG
jgi:hypothetical protein